MKFKSIKYVVLLFLICLFVFLFLITFISAYTIEDQNGVCQYLNLSFVDCYEFWDLVENPLNMTCENTTIYENITNNVCISDFNCTDLLNT